MSRNEERKNGFLKNVFDFFVNPVAVFTYSLLFALAASQRLGENVPYAILSVAIVYTMGSVVYAIWNEKISARKAVDENRVLKGRVAALESEAETLRNEINILEMEVPKAIEYSLVEKQILLKDDKGNAHYKMAYHGKNISESQTSLKKVRHFLTTEKKLEENQLTNLKFNSEDVHPEVVHTEWIKNAKTTWRNDIYLETTQPVDFDQPLDTAYEAELTEEYPDAFRGGTSISLHEVSVKTDCLTVEITAPDGFYFANPSFDVRDIFSDIEIHSEKDRISKKCNPLPMQDRKKIVWRIPNPRLSYKYILMFGLKKR